MDRTMVQIEARGLALSFYLLISQSQAVAGPWEGVFLGEAVHHGGE